MQQTQMRKAYSCYRATVLTRRLYLLEYSALAAEIGASARGAAEVFSPETIAAKTTETYPIRIGS